MINNNIGQTSLKRNFSLNVALSISSFIFPLITFPYVSRILLPEGIGKISFITSVIAYFSMFAQLGISTYGIRACAKVRDDRTKLSQTVQDLLSINLVMVFVSYIILAISVVIIQKLRDEYHLVMIMSCTIILNSIGMEWLYKALEQYQYITIRSLFFKLISLGAVFLFIHQQSDYVMYGGISIFAASASNIVNFIHARKFVDFTLQHQIDWKRHINKLILFFALSCAATVYTNLDSLMLGFMTSNTDVGYYNAAVKIKNVLVSVVTALGAVILPRSSYYVEQGKMEEFHHITEKAIRFVIIFAFGLMLYFMLFSDECILLLSGSAYSNAVLPMRIIMPTVLFIGLTNIMGIQILVPLGREIVVLQSEIAGAIIDLVINLILIPRYKAVGAAIGTLSAELVVLVVQYSALKMDVGEIIKKYNWKRLVLALCLGTGFCLWIKTVNLQPFTSVLFSSFCFFCVYGLVLIWKKEEIVTELLMIVRNKLQIS